MKKLWHTTGRLVFWMTWPLLYAYLRFSTRTRVFIFCDDDVLVVKGWLGAGNWTFPGGGLHRGEGTVTGAAREVYEETGITLKSTQLARYFDKTTTTKQGLKYRCVAFGVELPQKPELKSTSGELIELSWQPISELLKDSGVQELLVPALAARERPG